MPNVIDGLEQLLVAPLGTAAELDLTVNQDDDLVDTVSDGIDQIGFPS